jgi:hypothetical protein
MLVLEGFKFCEIATGVARSMRTRQFWGLAPLEPPTCTRRLRISTVQSWALHGYKMLGPASGLGGNATQTRRNPDGLLQIRAANFRELLLGERRANRICRATARHELAVQTPQQHQREAYRGSQWPLTWDWRE